MEDISFESRGLTLAGSFVVPEGHSVDAWSGPTALLLAGSGDLDRDGNQKRMALGIQRDLAGLLASAGWASLRYDKAGVGASGGDYRATTLTEERDDAAAALAATRARAGDGPVVIIGHSAGCLHASALAATTPGVAGIVLLSGPAQKGEAVLRWQAAQIAPTLPPFARALMRLMRQSVEGQQEKAIARLRATTGNVERIQGQKVNAGWLREFLDCDPLSPLPGVRVPVLAMTGTKDIQVDVRDLEAIARAAAGPVTAVAVDGVDHLLRDEPEPISRVQHYKSQIAKPLAEGVVEPLHTWLAQIAHASARH